MRAMLRADGVLPGRVSRLAVPSSFRCLVAHSLTTRSLPVKPFAFTVRQSAAPFAAASGPCILKLYQEWLEPTHPAAEYVVTRAANHFAHQPTRFVGSPHDLLDRHPLCRQRQDTGVLGLTAKPSRMLAALRCAQGRRINHTRADGPADRDHRPLHGSEKGCAGIFHQMPPVGDLNRIRTALSGGLPVTGAAVTRDDRDRRMPYQPGCRCRGFPAECRPSARAPGFSGYWLRWM